MGHVWYFAYGSNLSADTFRGRRGIEHRRAVPGRLSGWRLVFDKPPLFPIGESYANLIADESAAAIGVLYEVSEEDLAHIELSEGVSVGNYACIEVQVAPLRLEADVDELVVAHTLVSDRRDESLCPSDRYMDLVIGGALAHGLPDDHLEYLRAIPSRPSTPEAEELRARLNEFMRKPGS